MTIKLNWIEITDNHLLLQPHTDLKWSDDHTHTFKEKAEVEYSENDSERKGSDTDLHFSSTAWLLHSLLSLVYHKRSCWKSEPAKENKDKSTCGYMTGHDCHHKCDMWQNRSSWTCGICDKPVHVSWRAFWNQTVEHWCGMRASFLGCVVHLRSSLRVFDGFYGCWNVLDWLTFMC